MKNNHNIGEVVLVKDINPRISSSGFPYGSSLSDFVEFNNQLFFTADDRENGDELWVSDGTTEGTQLLIDINPYVSNEGYAKGSYAFGFTEFDGQLFFTADDGENGRELWVSDGTTEGTQLLIDINPSVNNYGFTSSPAPFNFPFNFTEFDGQLFFTADDGENGNEIWVSDGTTEGTQLFIDINPGVSNVGPESSYASNFTVFDGQLFFTADDGENGEELWVSDGTTEGTQLLLDINPTVSTVSNFAVEDSYASNFTEFDGQLFFTADDGKNGRALWVSDSTTEGTQLFIDINPGVSNVGPESSSFFGFTESDGKLFFIGNDGENGNELWISDGTTEGTQLLADINPFVSNYGIPSGSSLFGLTEFDGKLFFSANDGENGNELWVSDGTTEGTQLLVDINPGVSNYGSADGSTLFELFEFEGKLFFSPNDGENGNELWVSDGTTEGTQLLVDINPGAGSSFPSDFTVVGDELFFSANNGETGRELFKLTSDDLGSI